jgi:hypothetical protein
MNEQGLKIELGDLTSAISGEHETSVVSMSQTSPDGIYPSLQQFENETFQNDDTAS